MLVSVSSHKYVDELRRSTKLDMDHNVNNLSVKRVTMEYGSDVKSAVAKEVEQMIDKGVFE